MYRNIIVYATIQVVFGVIQSESFFLSSRDYRFLIRRFLDPYPSLRRYSDPKTPSSNDHRPHYSSHETIDKDTYRKSHHEDHCGHHHHHHNHHHPYEYDVNRELRQNYNKYLQHGDYHKTHYNYHHDSHRIPEYHRKVNHEKCHHPNGDHHEHLHRDHYLHDSHDDYYNRRGYEVQSPRHRPTKISKDDAYIHSGDHHKYKQDENANFNRKGEIDVKNNYHDEYGTNLKENSDDKSDLESKIDIPELLKKHLKDIDKKITKDYVSGILVVVPKVLEEKSLDKAEITPSPNYETLANADNSFQQETYPDVLQNYFLKDYSEGSMV